MKYLKAIQNLFNIPPGMKFGLETIQSVLKNLGNPHNTFQSIHVAGTNGKGSVSTKIAKGLEISGYKVGLFTSPHISSFRERIQINGKLISEVDVATLLDQIPFKPTFFETTTALAFLYFAKEKVDYAVIETGLGGRLDATNCIAPRLSIITSIALDHTEILGTSIDAIAYEKAGIIKEKTPVIIGPRVPRELIESIASEKRSPFTQIQGFFGTFDEENSAIAKGALELLGIDESHIQAGCAQRPPCRIEEVISPLYPHPVILDVAHNPDGLKALFNSLKCLYPNQKFPVITGLSTSKDIPACLSILMEEASHLYLIQAEHPRSASTALLEHHLIASSYKNYTLCDSIAEALKQNFQSIVICGTFFIMNQARIALGMSYPADIFELNERFH